MRFTPILAMVKLGILLGNRMYVSSRPILFCNVDKKILYFEDAMGLAYIALFSFQLILGAE